MKINLSEIYGKDYSLEELLCYVTSTNKTILVNDLCPKPHIEYDIEDLGLVWNNLRNCL